MSGLRLCTFSAIVVSLVGTTSADESLSSAGRKLYETHCARCHGNRGEGVETEYAEALIGDLPLVDLTEVIVETMPAEEAEEIVGDEAKAIASYIYDAFYSPVAQARNRPPRVELSRLTVRQYQHAVADLIGSFTGPGRWDDQRGLKAEYFNSRSFRGDKRKIQRVDKLVDFDFAEGSPSNDFGNEEFSIRWQGSVIAPDTGDYEFVVHTENGPRLWVNDREVALVDAWVRSGDGTEFRGSIKLLGGRSYPLRLEFFKFKEKNASIGLLWKPPRHSLEVIPERNLMPSSARELFVVEAKFPPDDQSDGYERGTNVSKSWDEATTFAAIEVANKIVADLRSITGVRRDDKDRKAKLRDFAAMFVERAFRRPLSDADRELYVNRHFGDGIDPVVALKRVILLSLKSPRFLFREVEGGNDSFNVASRLSFALWDSLPDYQLWRSAGRNELIKPEQVARHAERMVQDPRARAKLLVFLQKWLGLEKFEDLSKDEERFPNFNEKLISDLRRSVDLWLHEVVSSEHADFRQIVLSDKMFANRRIAKFYELSGFEGDGFQRVSMDPEQRVGVVSHPYTMAGLAYHSDSSPVHRGVFLVRNLLGRAMKPPKDAVIPAPAAANPDLTTRERIALQTEPAGCAMCHKIINPLGFTLENFDAVGRFRQSESAALAGAAVDHRKLAVVVQHIRHRNRFAIPAAGCSLRQYGIGRRSSPVNTVAGRRESDAPRVLRSGSHVVKMQPAIDVSHAEAATTLVVPLARFPDVEHRILRMLFQASHLPKDLITAQFTGDVDSVVGRRCRTETCSDSCGERHRFPYRPGDEDAHREASGVK